MSERQHLDDQKGPKTHATPAGVNRADLSEAGPEMAGSSSEIAGADHDPAIEGEDAATSLGDPAETGTATRPAVPGAEDPG
jgi:hypothetical protein